MSLPRIKLLESNNPCQSAVSVLNLVWKVLSIYLLVNTASRFYCRINHGCF